MAPIFVTLSSLHFIKYLLCFMAIMWRKQCSYTPRHVPTAIFIPLQGWKEQEWSWWDDENGRVNISFFFYVTFFVLFTFIAYYCSYHGTNSNKEVGRNCKTRGGDYRVIEVKRIDESWRFDDECSKVNCLYLLPIIFIAALLTFIDLLYL